MSSSTTNKVSRRPSASLGPTTRSAQENQQQVQQQFNQLVEEVRLLESYYQEVVTREQSLSAALIDNRAAHEALDVLSKTESNDLLVPIGGGTLVPVSAPPVEKLVVSVGAGIAVEKSAEDAKSFLTSRRQELEKGVTTLEQQRKEIGSRLEVGRATLQRIAEASGQ